MRIAATLFAIALTIAAAVGGSEPLSYDGQHDIGLLLARGSAAFKVETEDAVILREEAGEAWTADGRRVSSRYQLVLIRTEHAVDTFADLRVPFDGARQQLEVQALRTYRLSDRTWTSSGPTAVVETLPFAVERAPELAHLRETMLLHDGVELPCVLETAYTLTDLTPYRGGADGTFTFSRHAPAVEVRLVLASPDGLGLRWATTPSEPAVPPPTAGRDDRLGLATLTFAMGPLPALPSPATAETPLEAPHVTFSTWPSWEALGAALGSRFASATTTSDELTRTLTTTLEPAHTPLARARAVASLLADGTRPVATDPDWWGGPRPAPRVWASAYGDALERAALAVVLLEAAGLGATPLLVERGNAAAAPGVPTLDGFELVVQVTGDTLSATFDPSTARLRPGLAELAGRVVWQPGVDPAPHAAAALTDVASRVDLTLDLELDADGSKWTGAGVLVASGALSPYGQVVGLADETRSYLESLESSVLEGAKVTTANLEVLLPDRVVIGFALEVPAGDRDPLGRLRLAPATTPLVADLLEAAAVQLSAGRRGSAVHLPTPLTQRIALRLEPGAASVVRLPESSSVSSSAGNFTVANDRRDDAVSVVRELVLASSSYQPGQWAELRQLLLAEGDVRHRLVLVK